MDGVYRSRLRGKLGEEASLFLSSLAEDERIFEEDIDGTEAHDIMLYEQGIIGQEDLRAILSALERLRSQRRAGEVKLDSGVEDVHEFIEAYVIEETGLEVGGKLHSGRSRNDQVAADIRMRLRAEINDVSERVLDLVDALLEKAERHVESPMLLYTHTQHAQTGTLAHYLLSHADRLLRDFQRLRDCYGRVNKNPLGACAIGGTSLPLDRVRTTSLLGFDGIVENSVDAVSGRDFALEAASAQAILMSGLSRIAEDLILWSTAEFGYVEVADEYASVSSVMPQKKNPGTLELTRGKAGEVYGALTRLLTIVKGLPTGYNRDLQETKPPLWDSLDAVKASLRVLTGVISTLKVNEERMVEVASESYAFAVDLAERLADEAGLSFREAHRVVGNMVREMVASGVKPGELRAERVERVAEKVLGKKVTVTAELVESAVDVRQRLAKLKSLGSPLPGEVRRMLKARKELAEDRREALASRVERLEGARKGLMDAVRKYILE